MHTGYSRISNGACIPLLHVDWWPVLVSYRGVVHYGPGDRPLCGSESMTADYPDDPALVAGCADCLELVAEDLDEDNEHWANCLHCQQEISARNGVEWRRVVRAPCPHCGKPGW